MVASERRLWETLRPLKLNIRRQTPIGRYIADFVHLGTRLVIEVDSARHDLDDAQLRDHERDAWLRSEGFEVIRIRDRDAFEKPAETAERIAALIASRR
jgi:very-short-patch-repair endonuclease